MAEALGTAAAVLELISTTIKLIQMTREARDRVKGASDTLTSVGTQLSAASDTLDLVRSERRLQSPAVVSQVRDISEIAEELRGFFGKLEEMQERNKARQMLHALTSGDKEDKELAGLRGRLEGARGELLVRIAAVHVGMTGDLEDGFKVAYKELTVINERVNSVLGFNMELARMLREREMQLAAPGSVRLEPRDITALRLTGPEARENSSPAPAAAAAEQSGGSASQDVQEEHAKIYGNELGKDARIFTGNLGVDDSAKGVPQPKTRFNDNKVGDNLLLLTGNVSGNAASELIKGLFSK